jgi:Transglycosylase
VKLLRGKGGLGRSLLRLARIGSDCAFAPLTLRSARWLAPPLGVPTHLLAMILSVEDKRFLFHPGVDPLAVLRALLARCSASRVVQGASTITQQVYNVQQDSPEKFGSRTLQTKIRQVLWALHAEFVLPKEEILRRYLDSVYWGRSYFGIDSAASGYFGTRRGALTAAQSFFLAERLARPNSLSVRRVLVLMERPQIRAFFPRDSDLRELVAIYNKRFGCGDEIWKSLERCHKKSGERTSLSLSAVSSAR